LRNAYLNILIYFGAMEMEEMFELGNRAKGVARQSLLSPITERRLYRSVIGDEKFGASFQFIKEIHATRNNVFYN
jgi:hypothetical protein